MQKVSLDLIPGCVTPIVYASQYDDGRVIRFMLTSGGSDIYILSASEVITCNLTKPDGTETVIDVANPGAGKNYVDLVNGADDYDQEGVYSGEIVLTRNSTIQGTANFILKVEADAYDGQVTTDTATGNPCTFDTDLADNLVSLTAEIVASGGGGTPSTPIPIVGYSSANITRCGVNFCSSIYVNTGTAIYQDCLWVECELKPNTTYTLSFNGTNGNRVYTNGDNFTEAVYKDISGRTFITITTKPVLDKTDIHQYTGGRGWRVLKNAKNQDNDNSFSDVQLELGSTATAYAPYNGQTYAIAFGQTVYGGVLDVTRGKLKPCIEYPSYNGETLSGRWLSSEATYVEGTTPPIGSQVVSLDDYGTDIDLTPVQISALVGTNNITSDLGGDVNVTYIKKV